MGEREAIPLSKKAVRGKWRSTPEGLTIIEVLLAFFILGTGLAVIMQGIALGLQVRRESSESQRMGRYEGAIRL